MGSDSPQFQPAAAPGRMMSWRMMMWGAIALLLLLPLLAMQVTSEVQWTGSDFAVAAALLGGCGLAVEAAVRVLPTNRARMIAVAGLVLVTMLIWAEGAVGILS